MIVGSKYTLDSFDEKVKDACYTGMTRLEISICEAAFDECSPLQPSVKTLWHQRIQSALDYLVAEVLNDKTNFGLTYRKMSVPRLLAQVGRCKVVILLIGKENTWLINAKTFNPRRFVGTRLATGLTSKAGNV